MRTHLKLSVPVMVALLAVMPARAAEPLFDPVPISGQSPLPNVCGPSGDYRHTEVEPQVAVNPTDHRNIVAVWQQDRYADGGSRADVLGVTSDGGATWRTILVPGVSACTGGILQRATDPWVAFGPEGRAYFLAEALNGFLGPDFLMVSTSIDGGTTWSKPVEITHDAVVISDKGALTPDPLRPGTAYLVFLRSLSNSGWLTRTIDGGATWLPPVPMPLFGQGHQLVVLPNGDLLVVANVGARISASRSRDQGLTWSSPVTVGTGRAQNPNARGIRDFNLPSIAVGPGGAAHVVWERQNAIAYARSTDGGATWTATVEVTSPAVLAFVPTVAVTAGGAIGVSFYDLRSDTSQASLLADAWLLVSKNGGAAWTEKHLSGPFDLRRAPNANGWFVGDYEGLGVAAEAFVPLFARPAASGSGVATDVYLGVVAA